LTGPVADGRLDVLSASQYDNTIAWYRNMGGGVFGNKTNITSTATRAASVFAADVDGGRLHVIAIDLTDW